VPAELLPVLEQLEEERNNLLEELEKRFEQCQDLSTLVE